MPPHQASHRAQRRPALEQLTGTPKARLVFALLAALAGALAYYFFRTDGAFANALASGYGAVVFAAFALKIRARLGLLLVAVVFAAGYVYHLSATR